ncbi:TonB-dependent receptor [Ideonella sp. DXS22W]|uniref:TonB-dependent receptor n=1 Tax=Pseudaquabacterium inlustre TaxID=2984192 RepID=A0ABU9CDG8_9BURK
MTSRSLLHPVLALAGLALLPAAQAQTAVAAAAASAASATAEPAFDIGRVTITGLRRGPLSSRSLLTSVDVLHADVLAEQSVQATWELFTLAPGALLTHFNQGTTSGKVAMRGFNGEGNVNAVKLLVDGIPSNSNDGNMPFLDAVFPLELQAIEIVRGTNDARHGLHSIAGNIDLVTRRGGNGTQARLGLGAFNSQDLQLAHAVEVAAGGGTLQQNYFIGHKRTDGWRDHSDSRKTTLAAQIGWKTAGLRMGVSARHFTHDAQEPGYLTDAEAYSAPRSSLPVSATDGGERRADQLAGHLDWQGSDGRGGTVDAALRLYLNRFADTRWVRFSAAASQQERVADETHTGLRATISWRPGAALRQGLHGLAIEGGLDHEHQDDRSLRYLSTLRVRTSQTRDQAWTLDITGAYVQAVVQPSATLKLVPGWRVEHIGGHFENRLSGATAQANDFGLIQQPKFSAVWTPHGDASLYANWGRTFQVGVGSGTFKIPPRVADLKPSTNTGWELGGTWRPAAWIDGRLAGWQQTATDEVARRLNDPSGDSDNLGATRRRGIDLQLGLRPADTLDGWLALTWQKGVIVTPDPNAPATAGKEIDHVPRRLLNGGVDWRPLAGWKFTASVQGQGAYHLTNTNTTGRYGAYTVLNLGATWDVVKQTARALRLEAQLRNATDRATEYVWHDGTQALHSPGAPRALYVGVSASL